MTSAVRRGGAGALVREWRLRRGLSQLDLALQTGVSARHLSFVETGRAGASPELLLALAERLRMPLHERNALLLAAGYAPRYRQAPPDGPAMAPARAAMERLLALHEPCPGVVLDPCWNVVMANGAARCLTAVLPARLAQPPVNVFRACLHPQGLSRLTLNFPEWARYLLGKLDRLKLLTAGPDATLLAEEVARYPNVAALGPAAGRRPEDPALLVPWKVRLNGTELTFFTTVTSFGTPRDITLGELAMQLCYPADEHTARTAALSRRTTPQPVPSRNTGPGMTTSQGYPVPALLPATRTPGPH